jgi:ABC-type multidrug transport system fused ATPase/permease subunit
VAGVICAAISGLVSPSIAVILGTVLETYSPDVSQEEIAAQMIDLLQIMSVIAVILWVSGYLQYSLLQHMAEKISFDLRGRYLASLLKQEIEFYERQNIEALPSQIAVYFEAISSGVG